MPAAVAAAAPRSATRWPLRRGRSSTPTSTPSSPSVCRPASASSIACSAAASCRARSCCSAASRASASPRCCCRRRRISRRRIGPVLYCSGEESEHQIKSRGERLGVERAPLYLLAETCLERILEEDRPAAAGASHRRFDPDRVLAEVPVGAGQRRAGARVGDAAAVRGQGAEHPDDSRRSRHEGRQPRRTEGARARRRHGALFRGREASRASRRARGEEPVRRRQRARRLRDDRRRPQGRAESVAAVPRRAGRERAGIGRAVLRRGIAPAARRGAGARQHEHVRQRAADGQRPRSEPAVAAAGRAREARRPEPVADDVFVNVAGGMAWTSRRRISRFVAAVASSVRNRPIASDGACSARSAWPARSARTTQASLRVREAAQMGFTRCVVPEGNVARRPTSPPGCELVGVRTVSRGARPVDRLVAN